MKNFFLVHSETQLVNGQEMVNLAAVCLYCRLRVVLALAIQVSRFDDTTNNRIVSGANLQFLDEENDEANATQNDNEGEDEDDGEREAKWRTERLEREKFLEEHQVVSWISQNTSMFNIIDDGGF